MSSSLFRLGSARSLFAALGAAALVGCGDGVTAPRVVATTPAVTTDRAAYSLSTYTKAGIQYFLGSGSATFHNITDRPIYLPRECVPAQATMWLQREDGTQVRRISGDACAVLVAYDGTPKSIRVSPGDSLVQPFFLDAWFHAPASDAQVTGMTGPMHVIFDVSASPSGHTPVPGLDSAMSHSAPILIAAQ